jgi:hypothetical protein
MQLTLRVNNGNTVTGAVGGKGVLGVSITVFALRREMSQPERQ